MIYITIFACIVALVLIAAFSVSIRAVGSVHDMLARLSPIQPEALAAFIDPKRTDISPGDDEGLWKALKGLTGIKDVWVNASILVSVGRIMAEEWPDSAAEDYAVLSRKAFALRVAVFLAIAEGGMHLVFARFPCLYTRLAHQRYVEMTVILRTMIEYHSVDLMDIAFGKL